MDANTKAREIASTWAIASGAIDVDGGYFKTLCAAIELALKEQDWDTRHACAEAALKLR